MNNTIFAIAWILSGILGLSSLEQFQVSADIWHLLRIATALTWALFFIHWAMRSTRREINVALWACGVGFIILAIV